MEPSSSPVFPLRIFRLGQFYKFVYKINHDAPSPSIFWLRTGWMTKKTTFLSWSLKFFWANLQTHWAKIATYSLEGAPVREHCSFSLRFRPGWGALMYVSYMGMCCQMGRFFTRNPWTWVNFSGENPLDMGPFFQNFGCLPSKISKANTRKFWKIGLYFEKNP